MSKFIFTEGDWSFEILERLVEEINIINDEELGIDTYMNSFEIISSEQMLDAYSSIGMPVNYNHWSFGKQFVNEKKKYKSKYGSLAFEIVINSDPCVNYLMEDNTSTLQATVLAHAGVGHNGFFKNNYLFKQWTDASAIVDYLIFAKGFLAECEEKYGMDAVEEILDSCHALKYHGIDKFKKPIKLSAKREREKREEREQYIQENMNVLWNKIETKKKDSGPTTFPIEPEENVLKFIEKYSPALDTWQREVIRIVRKISQYFYPQSQTQVGNEGFATFTHTYIMNRLHEKGFIDDGAMLEFIKVNSSVLYQPSYKEDYYTGFNPYALGYAIYKDIERICTDPTEEDKRWFPNLIGKDPIEEVKYAAYNFRDESFILQYLSPKVMRDFRMFALGDHDEDFYEVTEIHNDRGYKDIRTKLAKRYEIGNKIPDIQVYDANLDGDRTLDLRHFMTEGRKLHEKEAKECMKHLHRLWGFDVILTSMDADGNEDEIYVEGTI